MPRRVASLVLSRKLGARIRELREYAGITQEKLAWYAGFAKAHLSQLEAGKSVPSLPALYALANRLGVDALQILAVDTKKPLHNLVDAVRKGDEEAIQGALRALGVSPSSRVERHKPVLLEVAEGRVSRPKMAKKPKKPKRT